MSYNLSHFNARIITSCIALTNDVLTTETWRYYHYIYSGGNVITKIRLGLKFNLIIYVFVSESVCTACLLITELVS
jgi:hypothetical protein